MPMVLVSIFALDVVGKRGNLSLQEIQLGFKRVSVAVMVSIIDLLGDL